MKKNDIMMIAIALGGGYLVYWYLTKNGPNGAVHDAAGQQIAPSYWDTWFGNNPSPQYHVPTDTAPAAVPPTVYQQNQPVQQQTGQATTDVRTRILTATGGVNNLNADQWNYYRNALFPPALTPDQFGKAFPVRTDPMPTMTVDQFLASLQAGGINAATGLGGIVPTPSVSSIPSMSFGGSLRQAVPGQPAAFRGMSPRGRGQGGGYIQ